MPRRWLWRIVHYQVYLKAATLYNIWETYAICRYVQKGIRNANCMTIHEKHIIFSGVGNLHCDHNNGTEKAGWIDWIGYQNDSILVALSMQLVRSTTIATFRNLGRRGKLWILSQSYDCFQETDPRKLSIKHIHTTGESTKFTDATYFTEVCTYLAGDVVVAEVELLQRCVGGSECASTRGVGELYAVSLSILVFSHQTWEHTCLGDLAHFRHLQLHQSMCWLCLQMGNAPQMVVKNSPLSSKSKSCHIIQYIWETYVMPNRMTIYEKHIIFSGVGNCHRDHSNGT
jgi:hypothetical protein